MSADTLGILDWGVGGVGCLVAVREAWPHWPVVYLSDSGAPPYGTLSRGALAEAVGAALDRLARAGAARVAVACHSASSALPDLAPRVPCHGMTRAAVDTLWRASGGARIPVGVLGGDRTVTSGVLEAALRDAGWAVTLASGQPLSALVEAGHLDGPVVEATCRAALDALDAAHADSAPLAHVLLACTHYPALTPALQRLRPDVGFYDPLAALLAALAPHAPNAGAAPAPLRAFTTGAPASSRRAAQRAFGARVPFEPWPR